MSTHKHFDKICCVVLALALLLTGLIMCGKSLGIQKKTAGMGYENRLFNTSSVHTIDIVMDDWDGFLENCTTEEYAPCTVVIDGEAYKNVAIRAKGNTSLTQVQSYGNDRYSFKIEFDHYDSAKSYYGLDKLCLNNIIQDNTYMKDYLTYQLMGQFGAVSPLCSYANITVNGETWGLYLAVEGVEEAFLQRNYGMNHGELYKPDSMNMGGGRGNGRDFHMDDWEGFDPVDPAAIASLVAAQGVPGMGGMQMPGNMGGRSRGSDDVSLIYSDDEYDSYSNIFDSAKTDITDADKDRLIAALKNINENTALESSVDIESVIRYFVVHNFVLNFDSYTGSMIHNYYLYEEDGALSMIPWDYNLAFGGFLPAGDATGLVNYPIDSPVSGGTIDARPMLAWIFHNSEYTEQYHELFAQFIADFYDSGSLESMIDSVKEMISPYVEEDPTKFCTYEEFVTGIDTLKEFCLLRAESVAGQLDGTIGSVSEAQSQDTLIDAGEITISAMGSMGGGMKQGGMFGGRDGGELPAGQSPNGEGVPDMPFPGGMNGGAPFDSTQMPEDMFGMQNGDDMRPNMDGQFDPTMQIPGQERGQENMGGGNRNGGNRFMQWGQDPNRMQGGAAAETAAGLTDAVISVGISMLFLLAGILFALKVKH